jgi:hypothetical protein
MAMTKRGDIDPRWTPPEDKSKPADLETHVTKRAEEAAITSLGARPPTPEPDERP